MEGNLNLIIENIDIKSELIIFQHQDIYHSKNILNSKLDLKNVCYSFPVFYSPSNEENNKYLKLINDKNYKNIKNDFIDKINFQEYNFDYNFYISKYRDAENLNYSDAFNHFLKNSKLRVCNKKNIFIKSKSIYDNHGWISHYLFNKENPYHLLSVPSKILNDIILNENNINNNNDFINIIKKNNKLVHIKNDINIKLNSKTNIEYFKFSYLKKFNLSLNKINFGNIEYLNSKIKINTFVINLEIRKNRKKYN